jgi:hypothetical protein
MTQVGPDVSFILSFLFSDMSATAGDNPPSALVNPPETLLPGTTADAVIKDEPDELESALPLPLLPVVRDSLDEAAESDASTQSRRNESRRRNR